MLSFVLFLVCVVLAIAIWYVRRQSAVRIASKERSIGVFESRVEELAKYQAILDVDAEVAKRRQEIARDRESSTNEIAALRNETDEYVKTQRKEINSLKRDVTEQQKQILSSASAEAARIVAEANKRADEVAGDAMTALRDAGRLEATAKAMKNVIKGYGDEYLVPSHSAIDDLAEEFSHKQAGVELKTARQLSKQMVAAGTAAECDYSDPKRRGTAIHFVLDAFNGKVDSILSRAKHDNLGKLDQEIIDAYNLVNHNGTAFRNARIEPQYLEARQAELRWSVAANELRLQEREEQRLIKEEMREEERARKEYEKAIREAEKEEQMLQKAMEKARKELQSASEEQRQQYEEQLQELEQKLREAEESNQRAISMAQQTKRGHVYVISNVGSFGEDVFKIGMTRRLEPNDRVRELGDASVPFEFDVHAMMFSEDAPWLESELHKLFRQNQVNLVNPRKEFFRVNLSDLKKVALDLGIETKWTLAAEAREYRETLAIRQSKGETVPELPPIEQSTEESTASRAGKESAADPASQTTRTDGMELARQTTKQHSVVDGSVHSINGGQPIPVDKAPEPKTPKKQQQPAATQSVERMVPCPKCKGPLGVSTLTAGRNECPHCGAAFSVKR